MGIFFKARGTNSLGLLILRLVLGTYTLVLGIQQASNVESYVAKVKGFGVLDPNVSFIVGFILPFVLILFGALYIMGFFTPITSLVLALVMFSKVFFRGLIPSEGTPFNKDIILLAGFLVTLFAGAGVVSFDAMLDRKKKKVVPVPVEPVKTVTPEPVAAKTPDAPTVVVKEKEIPVPPLVQPPPPSENKP